MRCGPFPPLTIASSPYSSPDYAEYVKFADTWLPARAGTDGALALAMTRVVLKEFFIERQSPCFLDVLLKKDGGQFVSDHYG